MSLCLKTVAIFLLAETPMCQIQRVGDNSVKLVMKKMELRKSITYAERRQLS